ncbi:MAG: DUF4465 domain-containing protein, partial [Muribaculaceae bacterium]|nr:DUF4465 domain-containing protein [Muribaculaceae bacterium]
MAAIGGMAAELEVELDDIDDVMLGEPVTISVWDVDGKAPYTYEWRDGAGALIGTGESLTVTPQRAQVYMLTVTDADGNTGTAYAEVKVYGSLAAATFDDCGLSDNSYWAGRPTSSPYGVSSNFFSGSFMFTNTNMPAYKTWGGFSCSTSTANTFDNSNYYDGQFNAVTGSGYESRGFAVVYPYGFRTEITPLASKEGAVLKGVYLTNNMYFYSSAVSGDGFTKPFTEGDYHKIVFTGDDPDGEAVEFYLADYRSADEASRYVLTDWRFCDLSPLGKVTKVKVSLQSSNSFIPAYACLDNMMYKDDTSGMETVDIADAVNVRVLYGRDAMAVSGIDGAYTVWTYSLGGAMVTSAACYGESSINIS